MSAKCGRCGLLNLPRVRFCRRCGQRIWLSDVRSELEPADAAALRIEARNYFIAACALFALFSGLWIWRSVDAPRDTFARWALAVSLAYCACAGLGSYFCTKGSRLGVLLSVPILIPLAFVRPRVAWAVWRRLLDGIDSGSYR